MTSSQQPAVVCESLTKAYGSADQKQSLTHALRGVSFDIAFGEFVALMGPSGCGKSTLLNLLGTMDTPTEGRLQVLGENLATLNEQQRTTFRREKLGFVFQFFNLLDSVSVLDNVVLPLSLRPFNLKAAESQARHWLEKVGLAHRVEHYPYQLSGGEMQRVAIARALIHEPRLLLADEPTGNLDSETGESVLSLLKTLNEEQGLTIIMATHSQEAASYATKTLRLRDGSLVDAAPQPTVATG